jgi:dihydroxyacetone kinase
LTFSRESRDLIYFSCHCNWKRQEIYKISRNSKNIPSLNFRQSGIKDRGKASRGEKTMIDALEPALAAFQEARAGGKPLAACLHLACAAAQQGIEFTKTIIATKGRASYLGERSLGHQDPGATSTFIMLGALSRFYDAQGGGA